LFRSYLKLLIIRVGFNPASSIIGLLTLITSVGVSYSVNESLFSTVPITRLSFLGIVHQNVLDFELWRFVTSQLVHVKYPHMIFNVIFLFILGSEVEKRLGSRVAVLVWLFGGGIGTYCSSLVVPEPWNIGTGASQAVLAFAAAILTMMRRMRVVPSSIVRLTYTYIVIAMALDIFFGEGPKLGHVVSLWLGFLISLIAIFSLKKT
jgi:rhomboid protease GluP